MNYSEKVKKALLHFEFCYTLRSRIAVAKAAELVFSKKSRLESDGSESKANNAQLSEIKELELVIILFDFFSKPEHQDFLRNDMFLVLFGKNLTTQRISILSHLIRSAILRSSSPILKSAGVWMQQVGCTSAPCLEVAQYIIDDFVNMPNQTAFFKNLPNHALHFVVNLMTATAELYLNEKRGVHYLPPDSVCKTFVEWLNKYPEIFMVSQAPLSLPTDVIAMPILTPLAGLIRWSLLSVFSSESTNLNFSALHLAIIESFEASEGVQLMNIQDLALILTPIKNNCERLVYEGQKPEEDERYQKCAERLGQAVVMALGCNCVNGNIKQFLCALETLPPIKLLTIVVNEYKNKY